MPVAKTPPPANWHKLGISLVGGAAVGALVSWSVNVALIEVSLSPFFSIYFGLLFLVFGLLTCYQVWRRRKVGSYTQKLLAGFGGVMALGGVSCFALDERWFTFPYMYKVPFYSLLGTSMTFCFVFAIVDALNFCLQSNRATTRGLVNTPTQIYILLASSCACGGLFGLIFGLLDIEDQGKHRLKMSILREEAICLPFGLVVGAMTGFANETIRSSAESISSKRSRRASGGTIGRYFDEDKDYGDRIGGGGVGGGGDSDYDYEEDDDDAAREEDALL